MGQLDIALSTIGALVLVLGLTSNLLKRGPAQEAVICVVAGFVIGPYVLGWVDIADWGGTQGIIEHGARLTLALALMAVALRIRRETLRTLWRPTVLLLTLGMVGMWLLTAAVAGLVLGLPVLLALVLGAVLAPTDPVVASSIVTGPFAERTLPKAVRETLSLESGANDGLAYALVFLPILLLSNPPGAALPLWAVDGIVIGIGGAAGFGAVTGYVSAWLLRKAEASAIIETYSSLSYTIALSLFTLGTAELLGTDALIAVFAAGLVHNLNTQRREEHEEEQIQEAIAKLFTLPMFVVFGLALPIAEWVALGWPAAAFALLVLAVRRPTVLAGLAPLMARDFPRRDLAFMGWFGPLGVAAMYYAALGWRETGDPVIWHAASAAILASILAHGMSAAPLMRMYARARGRDG